MKFNYVLGGSYWNGTLTPSKFSIHYDTEEELMEAVEEKKNNKNFDKTYINLFYRIGNKRVYIKKRGANE